MSDLQKTPFIRDLASSDKKVRDKATDSLKLFLRSKTDLSLLDCLKLWKGLFFCIYHSDRPLTQQSLIRSLSYDLVPTLPRSTIHRFLRAFWITISREFHSIDRLRLDKYLFLIRCYVGVAFQVFLRGDSASDSVKNGDGKKRKRAAEESKNGSGAKSNSKSKNKKARKSSQSDEQDGEPEDNEDNKNEEEGKWSSLAAYISIIEEGPLCPLNFDPDQPPADEKNDYVPMPHGPDGLRYHVLDLWMDEVEKVLEFDETAAEKTGTDGEDDGEEAKTIRKPKGDVPVELLLRPLEKLRTECPYKPVRVKAAEMLQDERLFEWGFREREVESDEESEDEWGGFGDD